MKTGKRKTTRSLCSYLMQFGDNRKKTLKAIARVSDSIDEKTLGRLPHTLVIYLPARWAAGETLHCEGAGPVIYLAPQLEREPQAQIDHVVAHEIAHVVLDHHRKIATMDLGNVPRFYEDLPHEIEATKLATKWGFARKVLRKHKII